MSTFSDKQIHGTHHQAHVSSEGPTTFYTRKGAVPGEVSGRREARACMSGPGRAWLRQGGRRACVRVEVVQVGVALGRAGWPAPHERRQSLALWLAALLTSPLSPK